MKIVLKRILVPTNFSEPARVAIDYGVALGEQYGAALHLLHVLDIVPGVDPLDMPLPARREVERKVEATAWEELQRTLSKEDQARVRMVLAIEWGTPFIEIIRYAKSHAIDLIAIGTRRDGHLKHVLLGDVVENVLHDAPCPVLTLHRPEREFVLP